MDVSNYWWQSAQGDGPGDIANSLRFRGGQRLDGNPATDLNAYTLSLWFKLGNLNQNNGTLFGRVWNQNISGIEYSTGSLNFREGAETSSVDGQLRDPSAWYHLVVQKTAGSNRNGTAFLNGVQQLANDAFPMGSTLPWVIGSRAASNGGGANFDGYLAEVHLVDGQTLDPTNFGSFDANMVWTPKEYTGTYGTNGFYLDFSDPADIGADRSGNGNNFTPNGFDLSGPYKPKDNDWYTDSPTSNNYNINPLTLTGYPLSDTGGGPATGREVAAANTQILKWNIPVIGSALAHSTFEVPASGKWLIGNTGGNADIYMRYIGIGICEPSQNPQMIDLWKSDVGYFITKAIATGGDGVYLYENGVQKNSSSGSRPVSNDTTALIAYDADTGNVWFGYYDSNQLTWWLKGSDFLWNTDNEAPTNGNDPTFTITPGAKKVFYTGHNPTDAAGGYGAQVGRDALPVTSATSANFTTLNNTFKFVELPAAPIPNGRDHFRAITDTGANILTAAQAAFPNGLWWIKDRVNSNQHQFVDSVRGANVALTTPTLGAEAAYAAPAGNSVAWCWNAPDSFTSSAGTGGATIASSGRRNVAAGFSIVSYTGAGDTTARVGHGLSQVPEIVIAKSRESGDNWMVYTGIIDGTPDLLVLNLSQAKVNGDANFELQTATWFNPGNNLSAEDYIAYCWHSVPGYSAFGTYEGNGSADGPFIYTGFRPAFFMIKGVNHASNWGLYDTTRDVNNPAILTLGANLTTNEQNASASAIDFVSNGFKIRSTAFGDVNGSGRQYLYLAFAENPFGGSNVSPANAR